MVEQTTVRLCAGPTDCDGILEANLLLLSHNVCAKGCGRGSTRHHGRRCRSEAQSKELSMGAYDGAGPSQRRHDSPRKENELVEMAASIMTVSARWGSSEEHP